MVSNQPFNPHPKANIKKLPLQTFIPSVTDCEHLLQEFVVLVARVVVKQFSAFKFLEDVVPQHIPHEYSKLMATKSEIVSQTVKCIIPVHACCSSLYPKQK